jgi:hypothetical protein
MGLPRSGLVQLRHGLRLQGYEKTRCARWRPTRPLQTTSLPHSKE